MNFNFEILRVLIFSSGCLLFRSFSNELLSLFFPGKKCQLLYIYSRCKACQNILRSRPTIVIWIIGYEIRSDLDPAFKASLA